MKLSAGFSFLHLSILEEEYLATDKTAPLPFTNNPFPKM